MLTRTRSSAANIKATERIRSFTDESRNRTQQKEQWILMGRLKERLGSPLWLLAPWQDSLIGLDTRLSRPI